MIVINMDLNHDVLTPEAEYELLVRYKLENDEEALEELIKCNQRLIIKMLYSLNVYNYDLYDDLIQEGNYGLIIGINRFDLDSGMKLCTYASHWIKHYILRYLKGKKNLIRLPEYVMNIISMAAKGESIERISKVVSQPIEGIEKVIKKYHNGLYEESSMIKTLYNSSDVEVAENEITGNIMRKEFFEEIESKLTKKEFKVIKMKFIDDMDCGEMGKVLGCSRQNAHATLQNALKKLRRYYEKLNKRSSDSKFSTSNSAVF